MAKSMKILELHYPMIQFLIIDIILEIQLFHRDRHLVCDWLKRKSYDFLKWSLDDSFQRGKSASPSLEVRHHQLPVFSGKCHAATTDSKRSMTYEFVDC